MKTDIEKVNYADFHWEPCKSDNVVFDFKLFDIESTMRRNVKRCAELGAYAVTISDDPLNVLGVIAAKRAGEEFGIKIIVGDVENNVL